MRTKSKCFRVICLVSMIALQLAGSAARANDDIFPPLPAAKATIDFDGRGFIIHGKREFIASGSVHMGRLPRAQWRDTFLKLKAAGFNTVQTYVFWNYFELQQGKVDFTGERDLGAFLQTAQECGLYATVRVGPYSCAEWDGGGYPVWLRFVPGVIVRGPEPTYLKAMDEWWDQLLPIVAAHQIHHGGNVILVQLENEHPGGWGTDMPDDYFKSMLAKAHEYHIEVPTFFSGLHHGHDSMGPTPIDNTLRKTPWYSTETWVRWYNVYGDVSGAELAKLQQVGWNLIGHGAAGYNLYMIFGGTNFDFWNNDEDQSSYDYGTLIGQSGDLRTLYYRFKRMNLLAASFPEVFANGTNASKKFSDFAQDVGISARQGTTGTVVFLENTTREVPRRKKGDNTPAPKPKAGPAKLQDGTSISVSDGEMIPVLVDMTIAPGMRAHLAETSTLLVSSKGTTTTWVVYGNPGETGLIDLELDQEAKISPSSGFTCDASKANHLIMHVSYPVDAPGQCLITSAGQTLRILSMTPDWADRTWLAGDELAHDIIVGPQYVEDYSRSGGAINMTIERPFGKPAPAEVTVYGTAVQPDRLNVISNNQADTAPAPTLSAWQVSRADAPLSTDFDDSKWYTSEQPAQMGIDGDISAYAWYRVSFVARTAGDAKLIFGGIGDDATVFINGKNGGTVAKKSTQATVRVNAGRNMLAVFVSHHGRSKSPSSKALFNGHDIKGVIGPVTFTQNGVETPITQWKLKGGVGQPEDSGRVWTAVGQGNLAAPAFYAAHFIARPPGATGPVSIYRITTTGLSRGSVYLNGHNLGRYPEKLKVDGIYLPECWFKDGDNELGLFDENGNPPTDAKIVSETVAGREKIAVSGKSLE